MSWSSIKITWQDLVGGASPVLWIGHERDDGSSPVSVPDNLPDHLVKSIVYLKQTRKNRNLPPGLVAVFLVNQEAARELFISKIRPLNPTLANNLCELEGSLFGVCIFHLVKARSNSNSTFGLWGLERNALWVLCSDELFRYLNNESDTMDKKDQRRLTHIEALFDGRPSTRLGTGWRDLLELRILRKNIQSNLNTYMNSDPQENATPQSNRATNYSLASEDHNGSNWSPIPALAPATPEQRPPTTTTSTGELPMPQHSIAVPHPEYIEQTPQPRYPVYTGEYYPLQPPQPVVYTSGDKRPVSATVIHPSPQPTNKARRYELGTTYHP